MKLKLGNKASIFHDPFTGLVIRKEEVKEIPPQLYTTKVRDAVRGGHLIRVSEENLVPKDEGVNPTLIRKEKLLEKTRPEIMEAYPFLDEEDLALAKSKKNKNELVDFLFSVEKDYE